MRTMLDSPVQPAFDSIKTSFPANSDFGFCFGQAGSLPHYWKLIMPLQVICPSCSAKLKAPDTAAGKKTKCPKCQAVVSVPLDAPQAPATAAFSTGGKSSVQKAKPDNWHMQAPDGNQYGPVTRQELDDWFAEGRVSAECQLLREGAEQWQWASEVYPSLQPASSGAAPAKPTGFDFLGSSPAQDPLGLSNAGGLTAPALAAPFGGGYAAPVYSAAPNPDSSPAPSYGSSYAPAPRRNLHPFAIAAGVLECFGGGVLLLFSFGCVVLMVVLLAGGATAIANVPAEIENSQALTAVFATFTGLGLVCLIPAAIMFLAYGALIIFVGIGIFKRKFWAKIVAIILSILHILPDLMFLLLSIVSLEPCSLCIHLIGVAINAVILAAMFIPDVTSDFQ